MCTEEMNDGSRMCDEELWRIMKEAFDVDDHMDSSKLCGLSNMPTSRRNNKVYGIDLGTTYSAIAMLGKKGVPEIIPDSSCGTSQWHLRSFFQKMEL